MSHLLLEAQHVHKRFSREKGEPVEALQNISLQAKEGEFISLVGPSGCGKTTLMKLLAGLLLPTTGEIIEHGNSHGDHDLRR